ncbi:MAG: hypothetical protein AAGM21_08690 [Pseudomonadota bacterium]
MRNFVRLFLFFAVPIVIALFLFSLSWPMMVELSQIAGDIRRSSLNGDGFDVVGFRNATEEPKILKLHRLLYWPQVAYTILLMPLGALLTPQKLGLKKVANVATAITLGILTSKIAVGYPFLKWPELLAWGAGGVACFFLVFALRSNRG